MFGFLRRRLVREQIVLIHQNISAAEGSLAGYFSNDPMALSFLEGAARRTRAIANSVPPGGRVSSEDMTELLELNIQLRRLYDTTASRHFESFDKATTPMMGWDWTIKRALEQN